MRRPWASALAITLAGCGLSAGLQRDGGDGLVQITIEAAEAPGIFQRRGLGRRSPEDTEGLWAVVAGLPRPETAVVRNLQTGDEVVVPLFRGPASQDAGDIRLSNAAGEALAIGDRPVPVTVTALRHEPTLVGNR